MDDIDIMRVMDFVEGVDLDSNNFIITLYHFSLLQVASCKQSNLFRINCTLINKKTSIVLVRRFNTNT